MNAEQVIGAYFDWEEKQPGVITNCEAFQAGAAYAATLHQAARVDEEAIRDVIVLLRAHAKNKNHHDAVFADKLEAAISAQPLICESGAMSSESGQPAERQGECVPGLEDWQVTESGHTFAELDAATHTAAPVGVPDGWKLAMWVLKSDLYHKLPEEERAVCDALAAENPYLAAAPSAPQGVK